MIFYRLYGWFCRKLQYCLPASHPVNQEEKIKEDKKSVNRTIRKYKLRSRQLEEVLIEEQKAAEGGSENE